MVWELIITQICIQRKEQKGLRYLLALLVKFVQTCVYQQTVFLVVWKLLIPKIYIGQYWKCFRVINLQNIYICCKHLVTHISQNINFANYLEEWDFINHYPSSQSSYHWYMLLQLYSLALFVRIVQTCVYQHTVF